MNQEPLLQLQFSVQHLAMRIKPGLFSAALNGPPHQPPGMLSYQVVLLLLKLHLLGGVAAPRETQQCGKRQAAQCFGNVLCIYKSPKFSPLSVRQLEEKLCSFVAVEWVGLTVSLQQGAIQSFVVAFSFLGHPSAGQQHCGVCWQAASSTLGAPGRIKPCRLSLMGYHQYAQLVLWALHHVPEEEPCACSFLCFLVLDS